MAMMLYMFSAILSALFFLHQMLGAVIPENASHSRWFQEAGA